MTDYVDGYCERVAPGLWGEPLDSLSNFAFLVAAVLAFAHDAHWTHFAVAGAIFALSLSLRALDRDVCDYVPAGTHFLWHLLNGVALYLVSRAAIRP
ncbi:hypothetical protein AB0M80_07920 [Amycolatopsis sp. NPDC051045]|uniref:hypothetical protein n=1 Tax=Amycolatopsis sp. NPDC051045 TaxID=3156922 RepID=UPI0034370262